MSCADLDDAFVAKYGIVRVVAVLFVFLPLLAGLFWGAPLVAREVEHGTHRMIWTQGVSRRRWALTRFAMVVGLCVMLAVVYAVGVSWWLGPITAANQGRFDVLTFDVQGIVPVGYTVFAVALGIFAGAVWRRSLTAMGITLVAFLGVRAAIDGLARFHFMTPLVRRFPVRSLSWPNSARGDWIYAMGIRDASGAVVLPDREVTCPREVSAGRGFCGGPVGSSAGAYNWQLYQPFTLFWAFQAIEAGIFAALALLLLALALRQVGRIS